MTNTLLLPEIWGNIFGYLDFMTVQKTATVVCKEWQEVIRSDPKLSGHLVLYLPLKKLDNNLLTALQSKSFPDQIQRIDLLTHFTTTSEVSASDINSLLESWKALKSLEMPQVLKVPILKECHFGKMKLWRVEHFWTLFVFTFGRDY